MRNLRPRGRGVGLLVLVTAGLAVAAGVAYATIPDGAGVYTACKLNVTGTIRLIDPSGPSTSLLSHCTSLETQITWNQRGPKGDTGLPGTNGKDGINGTNGVNGTDGLPGKDGLPGNDGANGTNGQNGADGAKGDKGDPCLPTTPACVGPVGPAGPAGVSGYEIRTEYLTLAPDTGDGKTVSCPSGKKVLSGGVNPNSAVDFSDDHPVQPNENAGLYGWTVAGFNHTAFVTVTFQIWAICAIAN